MYQSHVSLDGGKATHTRFTSEPQITSQNGFCGMRLLILTPTHTRFPFRQKVFTFVYANYKRIEHKIFSKNLLEH